MSILATILAVAVSLAAIGRLAATDPKRRRSFRLPALDAPRRPKLLWGAALGPGALLLIAGSGSGFAIWLGAVSVAGWAVAAVPPTRTAPLAGWISGPIRTARQWVAGRAVGGSTARIAALESRVATLETALARQAAADAPAETVTRIAEYRTAGGRTAEA